MYNGLKNFLFERPVILTRVSIDPTKGRGKNAKTVEGSLKYTDFSSPFLQKHTICQLGNFIPEGSVSDLLLISDV